MADKGMCGVCGAPVRSDGWYAEYAGGVVVRACSRQHFEQLLSARMGGHETEGDAKLERKHVHHWSSGAGPVCLECGLDFDDYVAALERQHAALREIVRAVASAPVISWRQNWVPQSGELLPRTNAIEVEARLCEQARALLSEAASNE